MGMKLNYTPCGGRIHVSHFSLLRDIELKVEFFTIRSNQCTPHCRLPFAALCLRARLVAGAVDPQSSIQTEYPIGALIPGCPAQPSNSGIYLEGCR